MTSSELAKKYTNILARAISVMSGYKGTYARFYTLSGFNSTKDKYDSLLDEVWKNRNSREDFIIKLEEMLYEIEVSSQDSTVQADKSSNYIIAYAICRWMDQRITYRVERDEPNKISLYSIIEIDDTCFFEVGALNDNYADTHVWLNPKFPTRSAYYIDEDGGNSGADSANKRDRHLNNRDALNGINGELQNVSYFSYDGTYEITNIVISDKFIREKKEKTLIIAFAPMNILGDPKVDKNKPYLKTSNTTVIRDGYPKDAFTAELVDLDGIAHNRMMRDWELARRERADVVFMPEMLGDASVDGSDQEKMDWLHAKCIKYIGQHEHVPTLTIWPSYWHDNQNGAAITYRDGSVIGTQYKHYPFVIRADQSKKDQQDSREEAIKHYDINKYYAIHIPGVHRISVLICSEFLSEHMTNWSDILCGSIGVSLLIVPSYSPGEIDFLNDIMRYVDYDTTVVWGNCCSASRNCVKSVGAVSKPGSYTMETFGENRKKCNGVCRADQACIFKINIPLEVPIKKDTIPDKSVTQIVTDEVKIEETK